MNGPGTPSADELFDAALVEEAAKKSALLWITTAGRPARPVWHVWHDGAVHILLARDADGTEQYVPDLAEAATAEVTLRSKDKGGRLLAWTSDVTVLRPDDAAWADAAAALHRERLNARDGEAQPERWARECVIVRLGPARAVAHGGALPSTGHAAAPVPTPAQTRGPLPRNFSWGKRLRGR
ncbi:hypothetical protein [Yinghuangia sp. YIM S10712]|uniref:hypothetical protein n=1 Tax=Yinghuangia sp. YIM S10712 TaxID=3436930 RepID=UPI003F5333C3